METASRPRTASDDNQGSLLLLNSRLQGTRRALREPVTCLGRAAACDMRLQADNIEPMHCLIVHTGGQWLLRDLESGAGTLVNGERVQQCVLRSDDQLTVGPFQFRVHLPDLPNEQIDTNKRALRVQVAAVAAQQVALTEAELRLSGRQATLEKQQGQLAARLDEKRQRLVDLHLRIQEERKELQDQKEMYQQQVNDVTKDLSQSQLELLQEKQQIVAQRERLVKLRRRLKKRYEKHWKREQQQMQENESLLGEAYQYLHQLRQQLKREKTDLTQTCLRFNADVEMGRRKLRQEWNLLHQRRDQFQQYVDQWLAQMSQREERLQAGEKRLAHEKEHWRGQAAVLGQEAEGLQDRVKKHRQVFLEQQRQLAQLQEKMLGWQQYHDLVESRGVIPNAPPRLWPVAEVVPCEQRIEYWLIHHRPARPVVVDESSLPQQLAVLVGDLADQRGCLVEHWEHILRVQNLWHAERSEVREQFLATAGELHGKAQALLSKEQQITAGVEDLRRRHDELLTLRRHLVAWQGRLQTQERRWENERTRTNTDLVHKEKQLVVQQQALTALEQQWTKQFRDEIGACQTERNKYAKTLEEYVALLTTQQREMQTLQDERRKVAAQALSVEQFRQRTLKGARNPAVAERKMEKCRRRWHRQGARLLALLRQENDQLKTEFANVHVFAQELQDKLGELEVHAAAQLERQTTLKKHKRDAETKQALLGQQLEASQQTNKELSRQITALEQEVEDIAARLLDEPAVLSLVAAKTDDDVPPIGKAA